MFVYRYGCSGIVALNFYFFSLKPPTIHMIIEKRNHCSNYYWLHNTILLNFWHNTHESQNNRSNIVVSYFCNLNHFIQYHSPSFSIVGLELVENILIMFCSIPNNIKFNSNTIPCSWLPANLCANINFLKRDLLLLSFTYGECWKLKNKYK